MSETLNTCAVAKFKLGTYTDSGGSSVDVFKTPYDGFLQASLGDDWAEQYAEASSDFKKRCGPYIRAQPHQEDTFDNVHYCAEEAVKSIPVNDVYGCRSCVERVAPVAYYNGTNPGTKTAVYTLPTAAQMYTALSLTNAAFEAKYLTGKPPNGATAWGDLAVPSGDNDVSCVRGQVLRQVCFKPGQDKWTFNTSNSIPSSSNASTGLSTGALVGIIVGGVLFLVLVGVAIWWLRRKRAPQKLNDDNMQAGRDEPSVTRVSVPAEAEAEIQPNQTEEALNDEQLSALLAELEE